jgi:hypothetical protein
MNDQLDLFAGPTVAPEPKTLATARRERDEAVTRIADKAAPAWRAYMIKTVTAIGKRRGTFTTDDVWDVVDADPNAPMVHDRRALGPLMLGLSREGVVERIGYVQSRRRHATPIPVWAWATNDQRRTA